MAYIGKTPVIGNFVKLDSITVVNGQAAYTMQNGGVNFTSYDNVNQFLVSLNGVLQAPTDSFTVSGSTLTFASNLSTGDVIDFVLVLGNSLDIGTPSDNTVTTAKLGDSAVTENKIGTGAVTPPKTNFFNNDPGNAADLGMLHIKSGDSGLSSLGDNDADELVIEGSANSGMSILSGTGNAGRIYFGDSGDVNVGFIQYAHDDNRMLLGAGAGTRMSIDGAGGVGINATPDSNNFLLKVTHDGNSIYALNANSSNASGTQYHIVFQRNGSTAGYITSNSATTIAFNNSSDERLKENIQNSSSAIQDLKDMQVRQFDWVDAIDTHKDFGFVAQELVNVVPEAVTQGTDELDENGKPVRSWGVDYSHIVPRLVKVCQEQQTKIEELEARITTLENA